MSSLFRITIEGRTDAMLPDTSDWTEALDKLRDAVEELAYNWRFPSKVKVTVD